MLFMATFLTTVIVTLYCTVAAQKDPLEIEIENGWVRGKKITPNFYSWQGIPYAKPPLGNLRFEPPQKPDNWSGTWDASYDRSECIQANIDSLTTIIIPRGNEDCLYINIYTPKLPNTVQIALPVMIWVYGGAFLQGNSSYQLYGPDKVVSENVIFVSFNYRLGIFGFITTGNDAAPGNTGLRDQILALKWVQHNIAAFGGDPHNVTVFGQSAGSIALSNLLLSPLTQGLFQRVILESGTALCEWGSTTRGKEAAFKTGALLGILTSDSYDLIKRLKQVPADRLQRKASITMALNFPARQIHGLFTYLPVIEHKHKNAVITGSYFSHLENGDFHKIPVIIGYNSNEVIYFDTFFDLFGPLLGMYDLVPAALVPFSMEANASDVIRIGAEIKNFYAGRFGSLSGSHFKKLKKYVNDNDIIRPTQETAKLLALHTRTYMYLFSYHDRMTEGAAHGDELNYLFNSNRNSNSDKFITECITKLWTNFAKYSNPTPHNVQQCGNITWKPVASGENLDYLSIDSNITMSTNPSKKEMDFWDKLFKKYGNIPFNTY
ncbi:Carboxylesterase family [Popillia japonica]|uniref:Carboxylic ester hydrolase n=1 Tax=Popillia japonica TaxID=7064 RepID=A0AAW1L989_POPJA